jgi:hypothetical protein
MKQMLIIAALAITSFVACKKDNTDDNGSDITIIPASAVPTAVVSSFNSGFSGATEVEWFKSKNKSGVSCDFNHNSSRNTASFDDNGTRRSHSVTCSSAPVPAVVLNAFRQQFPNDAVYEWKLRNDGNWKAHFNRGTVKWEVTISPAGAIVKVEQY